MKFYTNEEKVKEYPCIVFYKDNWDDYSFKITYDVYFEQKYGDRVHLGIVKILESGKSKTVLPNRFTKLDSSFASLGTSLEYYENLKLKFSKTDVVNILQSLNDIAFNNKIIESFRDVDGYSNALLRFTSSEMLLDKVYDFVIENRLDIEALENFQYKFKIPEANEEHNVSFDYLKQNIPFSHSEFPFRINAIIGKNGTGKTQYLASLVKALAGVENEKGFSPSVPQFSKVIAISYSIFDNFPKPKENSKFSYKYIGYRVSDEVILTDQVLNQKLKTALIKIIEKNRGEIFFNALKNIIDLKVLGIDKERGLSEKWLLQFDFNSTKSLSSGQSILFFILSELISEILPKSFVLFDEPETHLHPAAVANLIETLYDILEKYDSYSLISTHSPLFLQNIPSRYIHIFDRIGNTPIIKGLNMETFGANISEISDQVFETLNVEEFYKRKFDDFNEWRIEEDVEKMFQRELSFNARLYLNTNKSNEKS